MNRKRNVNYIKPEDPAFLKDFKRQAGYDDRNHKFDELENDEKDFVDDEESEKPQVVVLKKGDLTAEEAEIEQQRLEQKSETKADLNQRVIFKSKNATSSEVNKLKRKSISNKSSKEKISKPILSFANDQDEDDD